ncbi:antitoxin [Saccharothrix australiensis]|uniref:Antitoxin protein of toxin-antitoxin system n=1 Tax=Saccharothrix australiensis TaxID=2072 RepID=A0A495W551_9PSEU|nr:antitoxin [Saccharothrix australiensis]RKT56260.1 antitoxin protein of toxin-antitoxin system [Saccharothrix australiensis]
MGIGDKFDELKDKAKDALGQHGDKAQEGVERAGGFVDEKTGGQHSEQIGKGTEKAQEGLRNLGEQQ